MSDRSASFLDELRNPEYTGENRCIPCTIANGLIAISLAILAYVGAVEFDAGPAIAFAVAVLVICALLIYLRGYLIPGTPEITERHLPEPVLRWFDTHPVVERTATEFVDGEDGDAEGFDEEAFAEAVEEIANRHERAVNPEAFLEEAGVIEPDGDDYRLVDAFADAAHEQMVAYRENSVEVGTIAALFDADPGEVEVLDRDYPAYRVGVRVRKWPAAGARIADVATYETLAEYAEEWAEVPVEQRMDMLAWLRGLLPCCPVCGGETRFSDDVIESCCGRFNVTTIACVDCGERLREFDPSKVGNREELKGITP